MVTYHHSYYSNFYPINMGEQTMKEKNIKSFPGQEKGIIQILIKHTDVEESVQLRLDLEFEDPCPKNS